MKIMNRCLIQVSLIVVANAVVVGFGATPARAQPRQPTHVACVGDSITAGSGATSTATNYPSDLQGLFGSAVIVKNFGHSGATLLSTGDKPYPKQTEYASANTFVSGAGASAVVDVIIMLGTNDSKPANWNTTGGGTRAAQFATDCGALIDHFAGLSTHPAVYLALPLAAFSNTYTISGKVIQNEIIPVLQQVAMQKGVPTIDLNTPTAAHPEYLTDGVHPNDNGYKVVAQTMLDGLLRVPQVSITAPLAGASVRGSVTVTASASGGNVPITSVDFLEGTTTLGTAMQAPFSAAWAPATAGSYSLTAKATDKTGAATTSNAVQVSVVVDGDSGGTAGGTAVAGSGGAAGGSGSAASGAAGTSAGDAGIGGATSGGSGGNTGSSAGASSVAGASAATSGPSDSAGNSSTGCSCRQSRGALPGTSLAPLLLLAALGLRRSRRNSGR
ncbi:MAG: GDSL-type esterase/lipase family protein [Myxococcales bacterium]